VETQTTALKVLLFQAGARDAGPAKGSPAIVFQAVTTELTLLVLIYARAFHRRVFWWLLPMAVIVSTDIAYHYSD